MSVVTKKKCSPIDRCLFGLGRRCAFGARRRRRLAERRRTEAARRTERVRGGTKALRARHPQARLCELCDTSDIDPRGAGRDLFLALRRFSLSPPPVHGSLHAPPPLA